MGCPSKPAAPSSVSGPKIVSAADIHPTARLDATASLTSAGFKRPMDLETELEDGEFAVRLMLHGEMYDEEIYKETPAAFSLSQGAGELYDPPIALLKYPMKVGDSWEWAGEATANDVSTPARALVTSAEEEVFVCGVSVPSVRIQAKLTITPEGGTPIVREMTFYFSKKRGLFKRAWGSTSIREPNCP